MRPGADSAGERVSETTDQTPVSPGAQSPGGTSHLAASGKTRLQVSGRIKAVWDLVLVGLLIRLVVMPFTSVSTDAGVWLQTTISGFHGLTLYERPGFSYPPVWGYLLEGLGQLLRMIGATPSQLGTFDSRWAALSIVTGDFSDFVTSPLFNIAFKTILAAADLATGLLILDFVLKLTSSPKKGRFAFAIWFLNPIVIVQSAEHGAFDVLVGLTTFAALALVLQRRLFLAGVALALAVLTKATPVFLIPLVILALVRAIDNSRPGLRLQLVVTDVARFAAGGLVTAGLLLGPELIVGSLSSLSQSVLLRTEQGIAVGGLNIFSVRYWKPWAGLLAWGYYHPSAIVTLSSALELVVIVASIIWYLKAWRSEPSLALLGGSVVTIIGLLLVSPITNPGYVLWFMPALVVIVVTRATGLWSMAMISFGALLYEFCILGPIAHLAPLASFAGTISVETIAARTQAWYFGTTTLWGAQYSANFLAIAALAAIIGMVGAVVATSGAAWATTNPVRSTPFADEVRNTRLAPYVVLGLLVVTSVSELSAYRPGPFAPADTSVAVEAVSLNRGDLTVMLRIGGSSNTQRLRIVGAPLPVQPDRRDVIVYDDLKYPISGSNSRAVFGVYKHLADELILRHSSLVVSDTDAEGLARIFDNRTAASRHIVVVTTGAFPATVLTRNRNLVGPWLQAGGTLVWGGDAIGYYSAAVNESIGSGDNLGADGPKAVLGVDAVNFPTEFLRQSHYPSENSMALGIEYLQSGSGVDLSRVGVIGAKALGWQTGTISSIAVVPTGRGRALVFGGEIYDEQLFAHDLVRILLSDAYQASGPLSSQLVNVSRSDTATRTELHIEVGSTSRFTTIAAFDDDPLGTFAFHQTVVAGPSARVTLLPADG